MNGKMKELNLLGFIFMNAETIEFIKEKNDKYGLKEIIN